MMVLTEGTEGKYKEGEKGVKENHSMQITERGCKKMEAQCRIGNINTRVK